MSYTPTNWASTDVVTASRMNALEQAVGEIDMSYTPNVWQDGDVLTASKMNALEQAVASGGGGESDFSTATVTIVNNATAPFILDGVNIFDNKMYPTLDSNDIDENPSTYLLFKGEGTIQPSFESNIVLTGTGNVTFSNMVGTITGDCTITIADVNNQS